MRRPGRPMTFEEHVRRAVESLPDDLRAAMSNVAIVVEDENPDDRDLYGLYTGVPLTDRGQGYAGVLPDKIEIYRVPLEEEFGDEPELLEEEIRVTVLHEIAHHFGIDEERLDELGWS
jgi:predicted Zn-dependent protease with MMP-like domain